MEIRAQSIRCKRGYVPKGGSILDLQTFPTDAFQLPNVAQVTPFKELSQLPVLLRNKSPRQLGW